MEREKKAFCKKEKIAGIVASAAIAAVPFLVTPAEHGYAEASGSPSSSPTTTPTPIHKIHTIFLPEHGTKNIDLASLYDGSDFQVTSTDPNVADWNKAFLQKGLLRINGNSSKGSAAKSTFTVTLDKTEDSNTKQYIDTFDVIVVSDMDNKFTITNTVKVLQAIPESFENKTKVQELLSNIDPQSIDKPDPYNREGNLAPVQINNAGAFHSVVGKEVEVDSLGINNLVGIYQNYFDINSFYQDPDGNSEGFNELKAIFVPVNENSNVQVITNVDGNQTLKFVKPGKASLDVLVLDGNGGVTLGKVDFEIDASEVYEIDKNTSVKLNLADVFSVSSSAITHYDSEILEYENTDGESNEEYDGVKVINGNTFEFAPINTIYKIRAMHGDTEVESKIFVVKNNSELNDNFLGDRGIYQGSKLEVNLPQMFPTLTGATVQYSVYQEYPSVTGITYREEDDNTWLFEGVKGVEGEEQTSAFSVVAKDSLNHITYVDKLNLTLVPRMNSRSTIYPQDLFDWDIEGNFVKVGAEGSDIDVKLETDSGIYVDVTGNPTESTNVTLGIYNNDKLKAKYRIPFNNGIQ
ncbi:hypothetical protein ACFQZT_17305 [Paenibacillus sp. GCM10027628]|uniref:hypothetical protein n=1 Tax=Paenibacillus sp. GCM10027628 TaxID=3273413 RepID=UPI0036282A2F